MSANLTLKVREDPSPGPLENKSGAGDNCLRVDAHSFRVRDSETPKIVLIGAEDASHERR